MSAPLLVLVSGSGRSVENLVRASADGTLDATVRLCISDRPGVGALERCARLGVPAEVLEPKQLGGLKGFSEAVFQRADRIGARLVVLAGFLRLLAVPPPWRGRVINIHPSLLPKFGGKGMYGDHVHRAVLAAGESTSGCTVHLVDDHYDQGQVVLQKTVPVLPDDTVQTLAARVFAAETEALPEAISQLLRSQPAV